MKCSLTFLIQGSQIYKSNDVSHIFSYSANKYLISNEIKSKEKTTSKPPTNLCQLQCQCQWKKNELNNVSLELN